MSKPVESEHTDPERRSLLQIAAFAAVGGTTAVLGLPASAQQATGLRYDQLPAGAFAVVAEVRAKPGKERELREATLPLVAKVRAERNNLLYFLQENRDVPGHFVFYEIFASKADFDAHNATPHVQAWFARLPELAAGGVEAMHLQVLGNLAHPAH